MRICEQCWSREAEHIDGDAVFWCSRCAGGRPFTGERSFLWAIAERIHFLTTVYPMLRYSALLQDRRNALWAAKLGVALIPPGQRAVDREDAGDVR